MMATRQYSIEQLLHLRDSPLVKKPENLPAIEQWIEYVYLDIAGSREKLRIPHSESQQQQQQQRQSAGAGRQQRPAADASPMGNFSTGQRPSLMQTRSSAARSAGGEDYIQFIRTRTRHRLTKNTEDITLGPPKTLFASSRTVSRLADFADKPATPSTEGALNDDQEGQRGGRLFGDKQTNRKSMNSAETEGRHNRESWTSARERRALAADDEKAEGGDRNGRHGRREHDGERRNGFGDRQDNRWGPREDRRPNGERQGGWREREKERRDRDWDRGGHNDKEPEWMEDPAPKQEEDAGMMSMPKNQEDFEKWKQAQHARNKQSTEETEPVPSEPAPAAKDAAPAKALAALKLEGVADNAFGGLGDFKRTDSASDSAQTPGKTGTGKGKTSRFMPMFAKKDEPKEETPTDTGTHKVENDMMNGLMDGMAHPSTADQEGFQRILQMLGGNGASQTPTPNEPTSPAPKQVSNGTKRQSRFTGFFDQTPKSPERMQSPQASGQAPFKQIEREVMLSGRGITDEPGSMFGGRLPDTQPSQPPPRIQASASLMSPEPMMPMNNGSREQQRPPPQQQGRMNDLFLDPPSRGAATPDISIQNLLASQRNQRQQGPDKNSDFLLSLLQTKGSRPPSQQARPDGNFSLWLDQQPPNVPETHAPKPRAPPPPGLFEDQLLRNHAQELPRQEPQPMPGNDMPQRRTSQRAPPGFFDEQSLFLQQQQQQQLHRRNFTEPPQQQLPQPGGRRMSGHPNLGQLQLPQQPPPFPPEFLQSPSAQGHPLQAPPPGFNPHMLRHPPGINNTPNIFQAPQPQQQQQQPRELPGFGNLGGGVGGGVGLMQQQTTSPLNAGPPPPGFYGGPQGLPPGFMQMRSPADNGIPAGAQAALRGNIGLGRGYEGFDGMQQRR